VPIRERTAEGRGRARSAHRSGTQQAGESQNREPRMRIFGPFPAVRLLVALTAVGCDPDAMPSRADAAASITAGRAQPAARCESLSACRGVADEGSCGSSLACLLHGRCTRAAGGCRVGSDSDCRGSLGCKELGQCSALRDEPAGSCGVAGDADCALSDSCRVHGECSQAALACVASSDEACRRSQGCRDEGRCRRRGDSCVK
jgi:hypothetical protein